MTNRNEIFFQIKYYHSLFCMAIFYENINVYNLVISENAVLYMYNIYKYSKFTLVKI